MDCSSNVGGTDAIVGLPVTAAAIAEPATSSHRWWPAAAVFAAYVALALITYSTILNTYFLSDDFALIGRTEREGFFGTWGTQQGGFVRPVVILSLVADHALWRFNPLGFHLTNVVLHAVNAFLIFWLMRRMMAIVDRADAILVPILAGAFFLVHPSHTEAVTWIAGRTDVIATVFGLLATGCFLLLMEQFRWPLFVAFVGAFTTALFSKESVVTLPLVWAAILLLLWIRVNGRDCAALWSCYRPSWFY